MLAYYLDSKLHQPFEAISSSVKLLLDHPHLPHPQPLKANMTRPEIWYTNEKIISLRYQCEQKDVLRININF
jgi:hypothetical protein